MYILYSFPLVYQNIKMQDPAAIQLISVLCWAQDSYLGNLP